MERLTVNEIKEYILANYFDGDENANACVEGDEEITVMANIVKSLEKLAEYEDREEKGELMKVKHGKWLACGWVRDDADECQVWRCSECIIPTYNKSRYCPYCGAKMEE